MIINYIISQRDMLLAIHNISELKSLAWISTYTVLCSLSNKKVSLSCPNCEDLDFSISNLLTDPRPWLLLRQRKGAYLNQFHCKIKDSILLQSSPHLVVSTKCQWRNPKINASCFRHRELKYQIIRISKWVRVLPLVWPYNVI